MNRLMKTLPALLMMLLIHPYHWASGAESGTWKLDDFEDGDLTAASGFSWFVVADDLAGGGSEARVEIRPGGPAGSRHVLGLTGRLNSSDSWPFAGAWVPLDRSGGSVSLATFEGVRLRVKGPARLQIGFRAGMVNYMADVDVDADWRLVDVPFTSLAPLGKAPEGTRWSADGVSAFGVTTPQVHRGEERAADEVGFEIDDVVLYGRGSGKAAPVASGTPAGLSIVPFTPLSSVPSTGWIDLGDDPARDGKTPSLPDATHLEAIPSSADGILWVRVTLRERPHDRWLGMNLVLDVDGDPTNGLAWWGANSSFKFDRLVTVWCSRVPGGCQGFIGVADADQVASGIFVAGGGQGLRFAVDPERRAYVVGVPRDALRLGKHELRLVAAVGSAVLYADDVPGEGAAILH